MPQLNVLPVNVSQNIESKDESLSFDSAKSNDDFSKYIDLHLANNKGTDSKRKIDSIQSEAGLAKQNSSSAEEKLITRKAEELAEATGSNDEIDSSVSEQEIAASGKKDQIKSNPKEQNHLDESEQLMSFLTKADNTLVNQSAKNSSPESLSAEQKAHYEAQLLLNSSNLVADLSAVAKALGNDQNHTALAPTLTEQAILAEKALLSNASKGMNEEMTNEEVISEELASEKVTQVKLATELGIEGKNKENKQAEESIPAVKLADNKVSVVSKLEAEAHNNREEKVSHATDNKTNTVLSKAKAESTIDTKTNVTQKVSHEAVSVESLVDGEFMSKKSEEATLAAEVKVTKQVNNDQIQKNNDKALQTTVGKEVLQGSEVELLKNISDNTQVESDSKKQAPTETVKAHEKIIETQVNVAKENQSDKLSSLPESQNTKTVISQNSETIMPAEKAIQTANQLNKNTLSNNRSETNQSMKNDLIQENVNKTQVKENDKTHLSSVLVDQVEQNQVADTDVGVSTKEKLVEKERVTPSINRQVTEINGNSIGTPQELIEQQSAEMLNPSVATEVSQSQKTNAQLHQETISLFRKDFTEAVKDKVMLMISQKLQQFDITLDPPELGNMQVRVNLQGEQAAVSFLVQSQQTKDALEQNMHKLRELLAEQGVDVGDANVEQHSQQSPDEEGFNGKDSNEMTGEIENMVDDDDVSHTLSAKMINSSAATVDYYA